MKLTKIFKQNKQDFHPPKNKILRVENGPLKISANSIQVLEISHNLLMGLGVSDFVSIGHIFAFLSSRYTFSSRARILKCQSRRLGESRIYHSPPLIFYSHTGSRHTFVYGWLQFLTTLFQIK